MFKILILISLLGVIGAVSAIIGERKKYVRVKRKLEEFEKISPPSQDDKED